MLHGAIPSRHPGDDDSGGRGPRFMLLLVMMMMMMMMGEVKKGCGNVGF